ncbi:zinc finger protein 436 isoform X2 [Eurytemora carolleeae]|uniref:zinc finger protein 436 isoform X2 n=1 Tax=Eurytemora carolleeae TaxID=1294199 RepID=UPI000C770F20|nr:zinc finger protein 436 isoform X2 [Eurytemora carolleeae]|eukprot:XP_023349307.1 zinc finger protein 436-like isoform X2 [Eurytemora affinis]
MEELPRDELEPEEQDEECSGFVESVVLALKVCFYENDMRRILIERSGGSVVYHHRACNRLVDGDGQHISSTCYKWFNSLRQFTDDAQDQDQENRTEEDVINDDFPVLEDYDNIDDLKKEQNYENGESEALPWGDYSERPEDKHELEQTPDPAVLKRERRPTTKKLESTEFLCQIEGCNSQPFLGKSKLREHLKKVHNLPRRGRKPLLDIDVKEGETKCSICQKEFGNTNFLKKHIKRHNTSQQACHICGQLVKDLQIHIKIQHTEKDKLRYFCEFCGRGYKGFSAYAFHIAGHTGERKYPCATCAKFYRNSSEQKKCEKGHLGLFKWNCSQCSYRCHQKNKFVRHLRTHTKSEPFRCPLCNQRSARKDYLQKHILKVHPELSLEELEQAHPNLYSIQETISVVEGELIVSTREPEVETFVPLVHMSQESTQMFLVTNQSDFGARFSHTDQSKKVEMLEPEEKIILLNNSELLKPKIKNGDGTF